MTTTATTATTTATAAIDRARLHRALNPSTVVVVGDKGPDYHWLTSLAEYTGQLYSVQLDEKEIPAIEAKGVQNFKSLFEVPGEIDLLICAVPRQVTPYILADAAKRGVGGIAMFTAGFAETGEPQAVELQAKVVQICRDAGMPLVGPNCMGVYNRRLGVKFAPGQERGEGGDISVASQSGTHGVGITLGAQRLGVKVTRTISIGNAAVLNECDYLDYLVNDPETPVIVMYLEGIRDGRRFASLLREATQRKPVILWRGGRSQAGARAVRSHTGSLASDGAVWDALVRQAGAIGVDSLDDAVDTVAALVHTPPTTKRSLALVAMTGGQSVAITDQFERFGFNVPELSQRSYDRLAEFFVTIGGSYRNPFDAASTIGKETENLQRILEILAEEPAIDGGVAIEVGSRGFDDSTERLDAQIALMRRYREQTGLPVVALMPVGGVLNDGEETQLRARQHVANAGFPVYPSFQRGAAALARVAAYHAGREQRGAAR